MFNLDNLPKAKIEAFEVDLPRPLSQEEIDGALSAASCTIVLPNRDKDAATQLEVPLAGIFKVSPASESNPKALCVPDPEAMDAQSLRWCAAMTKIPPKSLPRAHRPMINILKRVPETPTGNPSLDKGRRLILDKYNLYLWPAVTQGLHDALMAASLPER